MQHRIIPMSLSSRRRTQRKRGDEDGTVREDRPLGALCKAAGWAGWVTLARWFASDLLPARYFWCSRSRPAGHSPESTFLSRSVCVDGRLVVGSSW